MSDEEDLGVVTFSDNWRDCWDLEGNWLGKLPPWGGSELVDWEGLYIAYSIFSRDGWVASEGTIRK